MSMDVEGFCDTHRQFIHIGQNMGGKNSLGYGSGDSDGHRVITEWLIQHAIAGCDVRISAFAEAPDDYEEFLWDTAGSEEAITRLSRVGRYGNDPCACLCGRSRRVDAQCQHCGAPLTD
jgi:hypothetical protein